MSDSRTQWTQVEIVASGDPTAEFVFATTGVDGIRLETNEPRLRHAATIADFAAKPGHWLDILPPHEGEPRIVLLGVVTDDAATSHDRASLGSHVVEAMTALRLESARLPRCVGIGDVLLGAQLHSFRYATGRTTPDPRPRPKQLLIDSGDEAAAAEARRIAQIVNRARAWVEAPANRLTPTAWAAELPSVFEPLGASVRVIDAGGLEELGAEAILAVGRAATCGPLLAVVEWRGAPDRDAWDAVLVGKGLTFDSGGLNLKPGTGMSMMRLDMAGGAAALGALALAASRRAPCNVVAVVPMVENALDGQSYRPGDVIGSLGGLTIEIRNTDCEGRLVLADGIAFGLKKYRPNHVIDIATLTGTIAMVLLEDYAALYSNDDGLAAGLDAAGRATGERLWRMPCESAQDYVVESSVADVANQSTFAGLTGLGIGAPMSGLKLLQKFVGDTSWAHLDIAGTAWATRRSNYFSKDATGYGVRLLDQWLRRFETEA